MKKLSLLLMVPLLASCGLFSKQNFEPAVAANKQQAILYEELRQAFLQVVLKSKTATEAQKSKAVGDIEANRVEYYSFNGGLESFLVIAGKVDPARLIQIGKEMYDEYKKTKDTK